MCLYWALCQRLENKAGLLALELERRAAANGTGKGADKDAGKGARRDNAATVVIATMAWPSGTFQVTLDAGEHLARPQ